MMTRIACVTLTVAILGASGSALGTDIQFTSLDKDAQGKGNKGVFFRPVDDLGNDAAFVLTARSGLDQSNPFDPWATADVGTVYIDDHGAGVQGPNSSVCGGYGSKGISGKGPRGDEELIYTFDAPIPVASIILELIDIDFRKDDPVLFFSGIGSADFEYTILDAEIAGAFTSTGRKSGDVNFGLLSSLPTGYMVDSFKVRETGDHIEVNHLTSAVPEPGTLGLLLVGAVMVLRRRDERTARS